MTDDFEIPAKVECYEFIFAPKNFTNPDFVRLVPEDLGESTKIEMIKGGALYLRETRCEGAVLFEGWK